MYHAGIGFWTAHKLLEAGAHVIVTGRKPDKGQQCAAASYAASQKRTAGALRAKWIERLLRCVIDRAVERFKADIEGAHAEFMRLDLADFG